MNAADPRVISFEQSWATRIPGARCLLAALEVCGHPRSLLDVGCGAGHMASIAAALGIESVGVDINVEPLQSRRLTLERVDLAEAWDPPVADLVLCLEVAEHLPESAADTLCDALAAATGDRLVFSAATPGQGGAGHINEQPGEYWAAKLGARGLEIDMPRSILLRARWRAEAPEAWWYGKNVRVWRKRGAE